MSIKCLFSHDLRINSRVNSETGFIHCKKCDKWWSSENGIAYDSLNGMWQTGGHKDLSKKEVKQCWDNFNYQTYIDSNNYSALIKIIEKNKGADETKRAIMALIKMPNSTSVTSSLIGKWLFYKDLTSGGFPLGAVAVTLLAQKYASEELLPFLSQYVEQQFYSARSNNAQSAANIYKALQILSAGGNEQAKALLMDGVRKAQFDARTMAINSAFVVEWFPELTEAILDAVKDLIDKNWWRTDYANYYIIDPGGMGSLDKNSIVNVIQTIDKHNGNSDVEQRYLKLFIKDK